MVLQVEVAMIVDDAVTVLADGSAGQLVVASSPTELVNVATPR